MIMLAAYDENETTLLIAPGNYYKPLKGRVPRRQIKSGCIDTYMATENQRNLVAVGLLARGHDIATASLAVGGNQERIRGIALVLSPSSTNRHASRNQIENLNRIVKNQLESSADVSTELELDRYLDITKESK